MCSVFDERLILEFLQTMVAIDTLVTSWQLSAMYGGSDSACFARNHIPHVRPWEISASHILSPPQCNKINGVPQNLQHYSMMYNNSTNALQPTIRPSDVLLINKQWQPSMAPRGAATSTIPWLVHHQPANSLRCVRPFGELAQQQQGKGIKHSAERVEAALYVDVAAENWGDSIYHGLL